MDQWLSLCLQKTWWLRTNANPFLFCKHQGESFLLIENRPVGSCSVVFIIEFIQIVRFVEMSEESQAHKTSVTVRMVAKDLEGRKGKLFDFSKGSCVADITPVIVSKTSSAVASTTSTVAKTAGPQWFNMETPEVTPEVERDLRMIRLRAYMNPKQFYKRDDFAGKKLPEHFQIGTVIAGLGEKSLKKRERPTSITGEILGNEEVKKYARRVYDEVQAKSLSGGKKSYKRKQNRLGGKFNKKRLI
jgi:hypothetical protein